MYCIAHSIQTRPAAAAPAAGGGIRGLRKYTGRSFSSGPGGPLTRAPAAVFAIGA